MKLRQLSERVWFTTPEEANDRPVLGYVRGDDACLCVDAGNSPAHRSEYSALLRADGLALPRYTALTHWHWDHSFGLCAAEGTSIACTASQKKLAEVAGWAWTEEAMARRLACGEEIELCDRCLRVEYPHRSAIRVREADIGFSGELQVNLGGLCCRLIHAAAPHSTDCVLVFVPEEKLLFLGDAAYGDLYHNEGRYAKSALHAFVRTLEGLDFSHCLTGHDETPLTKAELLRWMDDERRTATG